MSDCATSSNQAETIVNLTHQLFGFDTAESRKFLSEVHVDPELNRGFTILDLAQSQSPVLREESMRIMTRAFKAARPHVS